MYIACAHGSVDGDARSQELLKKSRVRECIYRLAPQRLALLSTGHGASLHSAWRFCKLADSAWRFTCLVCTNATAPSALPHFHGRCSAMDRFADDLKHVQSGCNFNTRTCLHARGAPATRTTRCARLRDPVHLLAHLPQNGRQSMPQQYNQTR